MGSPDMEPVLTTTQHQDHLLIPSASWRTPAWGLHATRCVSPRRLLSRISSREVSRKSFFPKCLIVLLICLVEMRMSIIPDYFLHRLILKKYTIRSIVCE